MSNSDSHRMDRLEALADSILVGLQEVRQGLQETKAIANSNAKSIQALSGEWQKEREQREKDREQWEKDRRGIYQLLGQLTRSMSDFYEVQSDFYYRFDKIEQRQADMTEVLQKFLEKHDSNNES